MILSKEDCLSDKWNPQSNAIDLNDVHLRDAVFYGMQLYAKELAIAFAEWKENNDFIPLNINDKIMWANEDDSLFYAETNSYKKYTTEQLFELFLQSINQNER